MLAHVRRSLAGCAVLLVLVAGCGGEDDAAPESVPTWAGPQAPYPPSGILPVADFREYAQAVDGEWEGAPEDVAVEFVQPDPYDTQVVSSSWEPVAEGVVNAVVTAQGLADDSVQDIRFALRLRFDRRDGVWSVESARWSQRCRPGRGHRTFSPQLCV
jgi:hypothetical protein